MQVRTGEPHGFPMDDATTHNFTVASSPTVDYAALAPRDAQARSFRQWPETKRYAHALYWDITKGEAKEQ